VAGRFAVLLGLERLRRQLGLDDEYAQAFERELSGAAAMRGMQ